MANILDSLKGLITPQLITQASSLLGEDNSKVTSAISAILPSLLGSVLSKGDSPQLASTLQSAGDEHSNIISGLAGMFTGGGNNSIGSSIASTFLSSIFGSKQDSYTSAISSSSGVSQSSAGSLITMIAPLVAGFLGNKMKTEGLNLSGLLGSLGSEKSSILGAIPSGLTDTLGLSSLADTGKKVAKKAESAAVEVVDDAKKGGMGILKWLIPLIIGVLLLLFIWRTCGHEKHEDELEKAKKQMTEQITDANHTAMANIERVATEVKLPDGNILNAYKGGIEEQVTHFLQSDEYKNASPEQLKEKWFNFDNIDFKFGSATELTEESKPQLQNLIAILKQYKDAKIKIGAYTDKVGSEEANMKLSQERANAIKDMFAAGGIGAQIEGAEGYGDKHAKAAADAPDSERAKDRKISLRFVK